METLFEIPAHKSIVLQDAKRLPARFFAWMSGVRSGRARLPA
ncbi:hypothetical protein IMCC20628_04378 [Hoeflea sp. IMCC20628]|nr:hypothetical protein [Hoeflea sp. IMCC20628]AKI03051.1 hypothetical protein IMCC20628_04378 [Hoeflea sp. IMCC20628]